jgi:hypothetical protein
VQRHRAETGDSHRNHAEQEVDRPVTAIRGGRARHRAIAERSGQLPGAEIDRVAEPQGDRSPAARPGCAQLGVGSNQILDGTQLVDGPDLGCVRGQAVEPVSLGRVFQAVADLGDQVSP